MRASTQTHGTRTHKCTPNSKAAAHLLIIRTEQKVHTERQKHTQSKQQNKKT